MALTYTPEAELGSQMPPFSLPTVSGEMWSSDQIKNQKAKVIVFMCNHCPYVKAIESRLITLANEMKKLDLPLVGICSNDPADYPEDLPAALLARWQEKGYGFPYLVDANQDVARRFGAVCTPDFFVYDKNNCLAYRGRLDDSWKDESKVKNQELKTAVLQIARGEKLSGQQIPSMGCSIKWKR